MKWKIGYVPGGNNQTLRDFANSVKKGADVKVWYTRNQTLNIRELNSVAVVEDEDQGIPTICGALSQLIDTKDDVNIGKDVDRPLTSEWQVYNSSGRRNLIKWPQYQNCLFGFICRNNKPSSVQDSTIGISWLIRDGWQNIYEHDGNGNRISGSLNDLSFFVQEGYDIKIRFFETRGLQDLVWFKTPQSVSFSVNPRDNKIIITGKLTNIPCTELDIKTGENSSTADLLFSKPYATEWHLYNTTGKIRRVKYSAKNRRVLADYIQNQRIGWYVRLNDEQGGNTQIDKKIMPKLDFI